MRTVAKKTTDHRQTTEWLWPLLGVSALSEGDVVDIAGARYLLRDGVLRAKDLPSAAQRQTSETFGYKWGRRDTYESAAVSAATREWLLARYGDPASMEWLSDGGDQTVLLDAGCGSGMTALELFGDRLSGVRYLGLEISSAVDVAVTRFKERGLPGCFLQCDLMTPPLADGSVDVIFSEGVMHHTDSTRRALHRLARLLKPDGRFMFYVYRKKGPIREFADDHIRHRLQEMSPEDAWNALMPLTRLGEQLGRLEVTVDIPEDVDLLEIPAGPIDIQRLFYWHVFKAYYRPEMSLEEMNHINFDWYAPRNASRQTPEEVRKWCLAAGLQIERECIEEAGITVIARKH